MRWRGSSFQAMAIPNRAFAAVTGHFEILRQFQTIGWASIFAQAAEHAARSIVRESGKNLAAGSMSRNQPTTIKFSGQASAHRLHEMHNDSPVSGFMFRRGAPR